MASRSLACASGYFDQPRQHPAGRSGNGTCPPFLNHAREFAHGGRNALGDRGLRLSYPKHRVNSAGQDSAEDRRAQRGEPLHCKRSDSVSSARILVAWGPRPVFAAGGRGPMLRLVAAKGRAKIFAPLRCRFILAGGSRTVRANGEWLGPSFPSSRGLAWRRPLGIVVDSKRTQ